MSTTPEAALPKFPGFPPGKTRLIPLPAEVFSTLLPLIDDLDELKLTLFALWALQQKDRDDFRYLRRDDFTEPPVAPMHGLEGAALDRALSRCVERGTLLAVEVRTGSSSDRLYFASSPAGREAVRLIDAGAWQPGDAANPVQVLPERPNVFRTYEENIGALTPMIVDDLKDLELEYSADWLHAAIQVSVQMEKRHLRYIRAILKRWKKEGRHEISQGRDESTDGQSVTGRYADLFER